MYVLILQGSPRANGNSAWVAEEYKKAAEAAGHKVTLSSYSMPSAASGPHPATRDGESSKKEVATRSRVALEWGARRDDPAWNGPCPQPARRI